MEVIFDKEYLQVMYERGNASISSTVTSRVLFVVWRCYKPYETDS